MENEQPDPQSTYKQPLSLLECALRAIGFIITKPALDIFYKCAQSDSISAEDRRDMQLCITEYAEFFDSNIPIRLHDIVTEHSRQCVPVDIVSNLKSNTDGLSYLDIILRSHTKRLDMFEWPLKMCNALYLSLQRLKNLQYLKLRAIYLTENLNRVTEGIKNMKNLNSFECDYCRNEVVKILCENCPLRKLNIYYSFQVTDLSLPDILKLRNLEQLNILRCNLSTESQFQILSSLSHLKTILCNDLNLFLAQINDDSVKMPFQSVKYFCRTQADIVNLTKYCPFIMDLDMIVTMFLLSSPGNDLSGLAALNHIKKLRVYSDYSLELTKIKTFLEAKGYQLIDLELHHLEDTPTETLNEIKRLCPNLRSLIVKKGF